MRKRIVPPALWLLLILTTVAAVPVTAGETIFVPVKKPSLLDMLRRQTSLDFCGEPVPLDNPDVRERFEKEMLLSAGDRPQVILWLKRAARHMPLIEKRLKENGMPGDLRFVAVAESALRPHAGSSKGATGYWQFMKATGRRYGLRIDKQVDERRNIHLSTDAAIRYFKKLHDELGSWTLAAAAYNMGEKGLRTEIIAQETNDYYRLYLFLETQRYIFRILAIKQILTNPEAFGFDFRPADGYQPLSYETVSVTAPEAVSLQVVARAAGTDFKVIKDLNPQFRGHYLAKGKHQVMVPAGAAAGFAARFKKDSGAWRKKRERHVYIVRKGDNLTTIANKFDVPLPALLIWNNLSPRRTIHPGDRLIVHPGEGGG